MQYSFSSEKSVNAGYKVTRKNKKSEKEDKNVLKTQVQRRWLIPDGERPRVFIKWPFSMRSYNLQNCKFNWPIAFPVKCFNRNGCFSIHHDEFDCININVFTCLYRSYAKCRKHLQCFNSNRGKSFYVRPMHVISRQFKFMNISYCLTKFWYDYHNSHPLVLRSSQIKNRFSLIFLQGLKNIQ